MRQTLLLHDLWQTSKSADHCAYERSFELSEDFCDGRIFLEFPNMESEVSVSLNGAEVAGGESALRRLKVGDWVHAGPNKIELSSASELSEVAFERGRIVSYDKVSISDIDVDPEIIDDNVANVWMTIKVDNHTVEDQDVLASIVMGQGDCKEKVEIAGCISPFGGEVEAVIRITDPEMWAPDESGETPMFDCLIGLAVKGEVMDVAAVRFNVA